MEHYLVVIIIIGVALLLVGGVFCTYQVYKLVQVDAVCRGLKRPKLWAFIAASGNNASGLILYLIGRRKFPILAMSSEQENLMAERKKKFGVGLIFIVAGGIVFVLSIMYMR